MDFKQSDLAFLKECNVEHIDITITSSYEVQLDHINGPIVCILLKDAFTLDQSKGSLALQALHSYKSRIWNLGCEAVA
jgi:hypothetical protein